MVIGPALSSALQKALGQPALKISKTQPIGGGDIAAAYRLETSRGPLFLKSGPLSYRPLFEAEADGLEALADTSTPVPRVIFLGKVDRYAALVQPWQSLSGPPDWERAGRMLAALHSHQSAEHFGWRRDNFIGTTPQINTPSHCWQHFFLNQRLGYQYGCAASNRAPKGVLKKLDRLIERGGVLLSSRPPVSLLHGDLWRGNIGFNEAGAPMLYDPAVYLGDSEADLAMTGLFGGFSDRFYGAYRELRPLPSDYRQRHTLYNLYHLLNHFNLFGTSYLSSVEHHLDWLLSEIG